MRRSRSLVLVGALTTFTAFTAAFHPLVGPDVPEAATVGLTDAAWTDTEHVQGQAAYAVARDCDTAGRYLARAEAQLLSGSIAGLDLSTLAGLEGLTVDNDGTGAVPVPGVAIPAGPDAFRDPLTVTAVDSLVTVGLTDVVQLAAPGVSAGVLAQYGRAASDGEAAAAAGAVSDSGALLVGPSGSGAGPLPSPATVDLAELAPGLSDLVGARLEVGALVAGATLDGCLRDEGGDGLTRDYGLTTLSVVVDSPAVADLVTTTTTAVAAVDATVDALEVTLATAAGAALVGTNVLGPTSATIAVDLDTAVAPLLTQRLDDGVVAVDLAAGTIEVDLDALTGGLNSLPPDTSLVLPDAAVTADLVARVDALLAAWVADVDDVVDTALRAAAVEINVGLTVPVVGTTISVSITGTLQQIIDGTATVSAPLLPGAGALVLPVLVGPVLDALFNPGGALDVLDSTLLAAVPPVLSRVDTTLGGLDGVVDLVVNAHSYDDGNGDGVDDGPLDDRFGVTALRVDVLAGTGLGTRVDLATATVGPVREL